METKTNLPPALSLLSSERPRNLGVSGASGLLFGDWGTSRLYVLGIAFLVAGRTSFWLILAMNLLILAVAWAYTQICRIYTEGGGVYTAARATHPLLGVLAALLLFADYTVTASLSALDAFHYFGLEKPAAHEVVQAVDAGDAIIPQTEGDGSTGLPFYRWDGAAFWAIIAMLLIGGLNLLGPKHSSVIAVGVAGAMIFLTVLVVGFALPQIDWSEMPGRIGNWRQAPSQLWTSFVGIVLALSGVEAIASLTGVMKKPVYKTASRSIWLVAAEVTLFNMLLAIVMLGIFPLDRELHKDDMLAHMATHYIGPWGEWPVRILAGLLLLSAANTAIGALMGLLYVMSRDNELPRWLQVLNGFGAPWIAAGVATVVPAVVLMFVSDVSGLAHLYAIGIVGAVAINCVLCALHPRLRKYSRKIPMFLLGTLLAAIWVTIAIVKWEASVFVAIILFLGFSLRFATKYAAGKRPKPSLLRQAIIEQLPADVLAKPKVLLATAGSTNMAGPALESAKASDAALVVCFIRQVALNYKLESVERRMTLDTDIAAVELFADFLELGHREGVPIIPVYDTGTDAAEVIAEHAAMNGVQKVIIGTSRRGALHQLIKGSFQRKLEALLPPEITVQVLSAPEVAANTSMN